jgi:hypothetical protein
MSDFADICREGERVSREEGYRVMQAEIAALQAEIDRLRLTDGKRVAIDMIGRHVRCDMSQPKTLDDRIW